MNLFRRRILGLLVPLVISLYSISAWGTPEYRQITILYTNDTHGHLLPFSYPDPTNDFMRQLVPSIHKNIGGIARRATLIHRIEEEVHGDALVMDAGDFRDGTPMTVEYNGAADLQAMSAAGYNVVTPGNHDYGVRLADFRRLIANASFPLVSANTTDKVTGQYILPPYKIFKIDGVKIAVFGLTVRWDLPICRDSVEIGDPIEAAKKIVPQLRKQADIVIALTHLGIDSDPEYMRLAEVPGIDIIVDGHSHTRLTKPILVRHEGIPQAFRFSSTAVVEDGQWGGELGRLDLQLRRDGGPYALMSVKDRLIPVTSDIPEDPATAKVVNNYYRPIAHKYSEILGYATADLADGPNGENALGSLLCDALRSYEGTQVGIYNVGGVRGDIAKGPIKMWDIACVFPFDNRVVTLKVSGKRLKQGLLEYSPYVSGVRYRVKDRQLLDATIGGKPVEDDSIYTVAAADYSAGAIFSDVPVKSTGVGYRVPLSEYIRSKKTIAPPNDGRRITDAQ